MHTGSTCNWLKKPLHTNGHFTSGNVIHWPTPKSYPPLLKNMTKKSEAADRWSFLPSTQEAGKIHRRSQHVCTLNATFLR
ncbi:hypothetical protein KFL_000090400 [Klebsormidium nitens]|uniref:Uncharacterized protein n=1 Tax=Klebsormidium nitens TaxID=105231 RepID=A0A1Y1HI95_KLENI|nr:hypothetical protein KFL_000090400 [Klebsormidium nitens]|eukprot:GAQ78194.1 hypothetical protein KFL_000090400 [Klebsormidium nitens]